MSRVLFLTTVDPYYYSTGGEIISANVIDGLVSSYDDVDVVCYERKDGKSKSAPNALKKYIVGSISIEVEGATRLEKTIWLMKSLFLSMPFSAAKFHSNSYKRSVMRLLSKYEYDLICIDHVNLIPVVRKKLAGLNITLVAHNVEQKIYEDKRNGSSGIFRLVYDMESRKVGKIEKNISKYANKIIALTTTEMEYFKRFSDDVELFNYLPKNRYLDEMKHDFEFGLIGSWTWNANMQGMEWFINNVYPSLSRYNIGIAGRGSERISLNGNVMCLGLVESIESFYKRVKIILIPAISGQGVQVKSLEALEFGKPVVMTSFAARGIDQIPPWIRVVDTPEDFISACVDLGGRRMIKTEAQLNSWLLSIKE